MTLCIIQARLGSTRLPRKTLLEIDGKPLVQHVIDRARTIRGVDEVVLACPSVDRDAFMQARLDVFMVWGWNGLESDVLGRYAWVAEQHVADTVMRVTSDCPLLNPRECERVLALYRSDPSIEYAWNVAPGYVDGEDCEVFSAHALQWANREARDPFDREHVGPWMRRHVKMATLRPEIDRRHLKTSVDTVDDLERVRQMVQAC